MRHWLLDHLPFDRERAQRLGFFLLRTVFGTWAALIAIIAGHITFLQAVPTSWFINVQSIAVAQKGGEPFIEVQRRTRYDTPVMIFVELHSAQDPSRQYCTNSYPTISEATVTQTVEAPLAKLLPFCRFGQLPRDEAFVLQVTWRLDLDYGIHKQTNGASAPFTIDFDALRAAGREN